MEDHHQIEISRQVINSPQAQAQIDVPIDESPVSINNRTSRPFSMISYSTPNHQLNTPSASLNQNHHYHHHHHHHQSLNSSQRNPNLNLTNPSKRTTRWTVIVLPPDILPHSPPPLHVSGFAHGYGPPGRYSDGLLLPLQPTLPLQLAAISREFSLPSIGGLCLHLSLTSNKNQFPQAGPRLTDDSWSVLFGWAFDENISSIHSGLLPELGLPIAARLEFDIDLRKARWFESWAVVNQSDQRKSLNIQSQSTENPFGPISKSRTHPKQSLSSSSFSPGGVRALMITTGRKTSIKSLGLSSDDDLADIERPAPITEEEHLHHHPISSQLSDHQSSSKSHPSNHSQSHTTLSNDITLTPKYNQHQLFDPSPQNFNDNNQTFSLLNSQESSSPHDINLQHQVTVDTKQLESVNHQDQVKKHQNQTSASNTFQNASSSIKLTDFKQDSITKTVDENKIVSKQLQVKSPPLSSEIKSVKQVQPELEKHLVTKRQAQLDLEFNEINHIQARLADELTQQQQLVIEKRLVTQQPKTTPVIELAKQHTSEIYRPINDDQQAQPNLIDNQSNQIQSTTKLLNQSQSEFDNQTHKEPTIKPILETETIILISNINQKDQNLQIPLEAQSPNSHSTDLSPPSAPPSPQSIAHFINQESSLPTHSGELDRLNVFKKDDGHTDHRGRQMDHKKDRFLSNPSSKSESINKTLIDPPIKARDSSFSPNLGRSVNRFSGEEELIKRRLQTQKGSQDSQKLIDEINRLVDEKAMAKEASIMSNTKRVLNSDGPLSPRLMPFKETPKVPPPPPTRSKVIQLAKAFNFEDSHSNLSQSSSQSDSRTDLSSQSHHDPSINLNNFQSPTLSQKCLQSNEESNTDLGASLPSSNSGSVTSHDSPMTCFVDEVTTSQTNYHPSKYLSSHNDSQTQAQHSELIPLTEGLQKSHPQYDTTLPKSFSSFENLEVKDYPRRYPYNLQIYPTLYPHIDSLYPTPALGGPIVPPTYLASSLISRQPVTSMQKSVRDPRDISCFEYPFNLYIYPAVYPHLDNFLYCAPVPGPILIPNLTLHSSPKPVTKHLPVEKKLDDKVVPSSFGYPFNLMIYPTLYPYLDELLYSAPVLNDPIHPNLNSLSSSRPFHLEKLPIKVNQLVTLDCLPIQSNKPFWDLVNEDLGYPNRLFELYPDLQKSEFAYGVTEKANSYRSKHIPVPLQLSLPEAKLPYPDEDHHLGNISECIKKQLLKSPISVMAPTLSEAFHSPNLSTSHPVPRVFSPSLPYTQQSTTHNNFIDCGMVPASGISIPASFLGSSFYEEHIISSSTSQAPIPESSDESLETLSYGLKHRDKEPDIVLENEGRSETSSSAFSKGEPLSPKHINLDQLMQDPWPATPLSPDRLPSADLMSRLVLSPVYQSSTPSSGQIPTQFLGYNNFDQAFEHSSNPLVESGQDINMKSIAEASLLSPMITDLQSWSDLDRSQAFDAMSHDGLQLTLNSDESLENGMTPTIARNLRIDSELRQPDQITFIDSTALLNNQINQHNHEIFEKQDLVLETDHEKVTDVIREMSIDSSTQQDHNELPLRKDLMLDLLQINQLRTLAEMDQLDALLEPRSPDRLPSPSLTERLLLTPTNSSTTTKQFPNYNIFSEVKGENLDYPVMVEVDYCFSQLSLSEVNDLLSPSREEETLNSITRYNNNATATGSQNRLKSLQEIAAFDMSLSVQPFIKTETPHQLIEETSIRSMDPELSHHHRSGSPLALSTSDSMEDSVKKEDHSLSSLSFSIVDQIEGESTMIDSEGSTSHFFLNERSSIDSTKESVIADFSTSSHIHAISTDKAAPKPSRQPTEAPNVFSHPQRLSLLRGSPGLVPALDSSDSTFIKINESAPEEDLEPPVIFADDEKTPSESSSSGQQIHLFSSNHVVDFGEQPLPTANTSGSVAQDAPSEIITPSLSPASSCKITVSSFAEVGPTGQSTISDLSQPMPSIAMQPPTPSPIDLNETILEEPAPPPPPILLPFPDLLEIGEALAQFVFEAQEAALRRHGRFQVALGGSLLPMIISEALASDERIQWQKWSLFLVEETIAPIGSKELLYSNFAEALLQYVPIPREQVHPMVELSEEDIAEAKAMPDGLEILADSLADEYENKLLELFPEANHETGQAPQFNLVLVSLGESGQVGSLYPLNSILGESNWFVAWMSDAPQPTPYRLTLTLPVLNAAHQFAFVAIGERLSEIVEDSLIRSIQSDVPMEEDKINPSSLIKTDPRPIVWFTDLEASSKTDYPKSTFWDE